MKILFIGSVHFSAEILKHLIQNKSNIVGVCSLKESKFNSDFSNLYEIADKSKIPFLYVEDINHKNSIEWIKNLRPDIVFCLGWSRLIKKELLNLTKMGVIGYHPSELPKNRGRHPIIWALALGLKKTGSTFFFMDEGADSGDILSQEEIIINDHDDAMTLYKKIIKKAKQQLDIFLPQLQSGRFSRIPQDNKLANYWRKRDISDGEINWKMSADNIYNLVRALTKPYVGAHFKYKEKIIKVWKCKVISNSIKNYEPGKVISNNGTLLIKTGTDAIEVLQCEPTIKVEIGEYL